MPRSPRDAHGELVPPLQVLDYEDLQCEHISPPHIFTDPDHPERVYAVCAAGTTATRCDYSVLLEHHSTAEPR